MRGEITLTVATHLRVPCDRAGGSASPGRRLVEAPSVFLREWRHERDLVGADDGGCVVIDRVVARPRWIVLAPIVRRVVTARLRHRHLLLHLATADRTVRAGPPGAGGSSAGR